jgi:hypothetical protein
VKIDRPRNGMFALIAFNHPGSSFKPYTLSFLCPFMRGAISNSSLLARQAAPIRGYSALEDEDDYEYEDETESP